MGGVITRRNRVRSLFTLIKWPPHSQEFVDYLGWITQENKKRWDLRNVDHFLSIE